MPEPKKKPYRQPGATPAPKPTKTQQSMSQKAWEEAFVGPTQPTPPPFTGAVNAEFNSMSRTVPTAAIPQLGLVAGILRNWMDVPATSPSTPSTTWVWGDKDTGYSTGGAFAPSKPDMLGLSAQNFYKAQQGDATGLGTLANELTHYYQKLDPKRPYPHQNNTPKTEELLRLRKEGQIDESPFYFKANGEVNTGLINNKELESSLMDRYMRMYAEVLRQQQLQQAYAPGLRPH